MAGIRTKESLNECLSPLNDRTKAPAFRGRGRPRHTFRGRGPFRLRSGQVRVALVQRFPNKRRRAGFTLIELMIVMSLILILLSISVPMYNQSINRAKESVLKQDLFTLRTLISQYTLDKQRAPQSLEDLKADGYLKDIPKDPMTGAADWVPHQEENTVYSADQQGGGIDDVNSSSSLIGTDGLAYSTY